MATGTDDTYGKRTVIMRSELVGRAQIVGTRLRDRWAKLTEAAVARGPLRIEPVIDEQPQVVEAAAAGPREEPRPAAVPERMPAPKSAAEPAPDASGGEPPEPAAKPRRRQVRRIKTEPTISAAEAPAPTQTEAQAEPAPALTPPAPIPPAAAKSRAAVPAIAPARSSPPPAAAQPSPPAPSIPAQTGASSLVPPAGAPPASSPSWSLARLVLRGRHAVIEIVALHALSVVLTALLVFFVDPFTQAILHPEAKTALVWIPIVAALTFAARTYVGRILTTLEGALATRVGRRIKYEVAQSVLTRPFADWRDPASGRFVVSDLTRTDRLVGKARATFGRLLGDGLLVLALGLLMASYNVWLALLAVVLMGVAQLHKLEKRQAARERAAALGSVIGARGRLWDAVRVIRLYGQQIPMIDRLRDRLGIEGRMMAAAERQALRTLPWSELLAAIAAATIVSIAGFMAASQSLPLPALITMAAAALVLYEPIGRLVTTPDRLRTLEREEARLHPQEALNPGEIRGERWPAGLSTLRLRDLSLRHAPTKIVLDGLSLDLAPGQMIGLVGPSRNAVKTLFDIVLGFGEPDAGAITLGHEEIRLFNSTRYRALFGLLTARPVIFTGTIAENIAFGRPQANLVEIKGAAQAANVHDLVVALPAGYDTRIGQGGVPIDDDMAHLISIARIILKAPPVVLADEPPRSADPVREEKLAAALLTLYASRTALVHTRRSATLKHASKLFVMSQGRVVETGTHSDLIGRQGLYASHYQRYFAPDSEPAFGGA